MLSKKKCHLTLLRALKKLDREEQREILGKLNDEGIQSLCSVCFNFLYSSILPKSKLARLRKKLSKHKADLKFVSNKENNLGQRRKRLMKLQRGGGISLLLGAAIPAIAQLISSAFKKK